MIKVATLTVKSFSCAGVMLCAALLLLPGDLPAQEQPEDQRQLLAGGFLESLESTVTPVAFAIQHRYDHGSWPNEQGLLELIGLVEENPQLPPCTLTILRSSDASLVMRYTVNGLREGDCAISVIASITRTEGLDDESYDAELETMALRGIGISGETGGQKSKLRSTCTPQNQCEIRWELTPSR